MALAPVQSFLDVTARHGISRSTQFRILGFSNVPEYVQREFNDAPTGEGGVVYLKSGSVPGRTLQAIEIQYLAFKTYAIGQAEYTENPIQFTFRTPEDFLWRNALEQWSFESYNELTSNGSFSMPCPNTTMDVGLLNSKGRIARIYRLFSIFPETIANIQYNLADAPNEVEFTVGFRYTRFKVMPVVDTGSIDESFLNRLDVETKAIYEQYRNNIFANANTTCQSANVS